MQELLQAITAPINWPWTFLMVLVVFFWCSAVLGAIDIEALDMDLDADADLDLDLDAEVDADVGLEGEAGADGPSHTQAPGTGSFTGLLHFLNMGKVPFTVVISAFATSAWIAAILAYRYLPMSHGWGGLIWYLPIILMSSMFAKWTTAPLAPLFAKLNESGGLKSAVGQIAVLKSDTSPSRLGQAAIEIDGAEVLINVRALEDTLTKGSQVFIVDRARTHDFYFVEKI